MTEPNCKSRVTCKRPRPNQHFHEILESLYRDAVRRGNSILPALKEAISSLQKYPLPLSSGAECAILKGFDQRLCKYIDAHINGQATTNKKSRAGDNGHTSCHIDNSATPVDNKDTNMTSNARKHRKHNKQLETNTEKCSQEPKFNEIGKKTDKNASYIDLTEGKPGKNNNLQKVQNKNTASTSFDQKTLKNKEHGKSAGAKELTCDSSEDDQERKETTNYVDFSLCGGGWESLPYEDQLSRQRYRSTISIIYKPVQEQDQAGESSNQKKLITVIDSSSDDESIEQLVEEPNNDEAHCQNCDPITSAAETFEKYFKEKTLRDAEEIGKCVLPRKFYKPAYRSGAYAILVALLEQRNECPYRDCLTKEELVQKAQKHTDQSFTVPKLDSNYTAWTNTKRLINKGLIQIINYDNNTEDFYMLTAMGRAVAMELVKDNTPQVTINDVIFHGQRNDRVPSMEDIVLAPPPPVASLDEEQSSVFIEMPPGTFDIFMLIDKRENIDKNISASPNSHCKYEARSLTVGDFLWVARSRKTGQELVLPYIMERKRMDDLASSIKDGRFHEQKFRLRKCGLKNVIYLVENYRKKAQYVLPQPTLQQALMNTSILDKFNIMRTDSLHHTLYFLGLISEKLVLEYLPQFLRGCNRDTGGKELMTFEFFNKFSCKNKPLTVRDTFIKMLLQLKGLSVEKALAITNKYSTPRLLVKAYQKCSEKEGQLLLANLKYNEFSKNIGPGVSTTVYQLFTSISL